MPKRIRPIKICGDTAYVELTMGLVAVIDAEDAHKLSKWNWHCRKGKSNIYAYRNVETDGSGKRSVLAMHREIMDRPKGLEIDHIDGDGLNNRKCNLRVATRSENQWNRKPSKKSATGLKGVSFYKRDGTWHSRIAANGKRFSLGYFKTPEEANEAYEAASRIMHGQFSRPK